MAPSTVKRWADQRLLPFTRTVGGHRRFEPRALETFLRQQTTGAGDDPLVSAWVRCLVEGHRHEIDGLLLAARARLGTWCRVADELGLVLTQLGEQWACGSLAIADEHLASNHLSRGLARIGEDR